MVLRGEAGIGKTALLEYLVASASDLRVVRAVGVESEMELAFASLHQLCAPLLDRIKELPAPQRRALETVFALSDGVAPDRFLVGLAVLSLFAAEAEQRPLLCVVDDAQWLDRASELTLAFVARRLLAERVGFVFAAREPGLELQHVDGLDVRGLRAGDARALLRSTLRFKLDEHVVDRIIAEMRGNPLALLELPRGLTATQLAGGFGLPEAQAMSGRIQESFVRRVSAVSDDARRLLLLAAAEPIGDPLLLLRASEQLGIAVSAVYAETDGLLALSQRVTFRHPLVRSAVYRTATTEQRREVHLALAEATDRSLDPDRRAWHLATAAAGPDEPVAAALEQSASRAQARGGLAAAAAFLHRSVVLSGDPKQRLRRALAAAQASLHAGIFEGALELLALAEASTPDELQMAHVELLRGQIAFASSMGTTAPPLLLKAAQRLEQLDPELARETYLDAWGAALFAGRLASVAGLAEVSRAAISAPRPTHPLRPSDLLLDGLATFVTEGHAAAAPLLRQATAAFADEASPGQENFRWGWMTTIPPNILWDEDSWHAISARHLKERPSAHRPRPRTGHLTLPLLGASVLRARHRNGGRARKRLKDHAVALGQAQERFWLRLSRVGLQRKAQPDRREPDRACLSTDNIPRKSRSPSAWTEPLTARPRDVATARIVTPRTGDQCLKQHVPRTCQRPVTARCWMQTRPRQRPPRVHRARHSIVQRSVGLKRNQGRCRLLPVARLQQLLDRTQLICRGAAHPTQLYPCAHGRLQATRSLLGEDSRSL